MPRAFVLASLAVLALAAAFLACSGTGGTAGLPPTTGVVIRAETLTSGRGCGREPTQLFKYAAVVFGLTPGADPQRSESYGVPVAGNLYDCFADGTFIELPETGGSFQYRIEIYAFNQVAFAREAARIAAAGTDVAALREAAPTWTTQCSALQLEDVESLAVCEPLALGLAGLGGATPPAAVVLGTGNFPGADGGAFRCVALDAGMEAGADAAVDASADAAADAGLDAGEGGAPTPAIGFAAVRVDYRAGDRSPETAQIACPETFAIRPAEAPSRYTLDVVLLDEADAAVGATRCTAVTSPGVESSASCAPVVR